ALTAHGQLKRLHALLHIKPESERARATLFGKPPIGSPRAALRLLASCRADPAAAAALVRLHRIPFLLAEAALGSLNEPAAVALVEAAPEARALHGDTALLVDVSMSMPREGGCLELAANLSHCLDRALDPAAALHVYRVGVEAETATLRRGSGLDRWRAV